MKPMTREWVQKAEADWATLMREVRVRKAPNYDGVCFHAQQCAEKYLKARLQEADVRFGKIHNLSVLLNQVVRLDAELELLRDAAETLADYAVRFRYPGSSADKALARGAVQMCGRVRETVCVRLGIGFPVPSQRRSSIARTRGTRRRPAKGGD